MKTIGSSLAALFALACASWTFSAAAATPASGTLSATGPMLSYSSGPFLISNVSGTAGSVICQAPILVCDDYALTINVSADYLSSHPGTALSVSTAWANTAEDYDIYLLDSTGAQLAVSASSSDPESYLFTVKPGQNTYTLRIVPYTAAGGTATTTIKLIVPDPTTAPPPQQAPSGQPPRFKIDASPADLGNTAGEPSIGYNFSSRNGMFISALQTLRITYPWNQTDPVDATKKLPEACDANWSDVSYVTTSVETLDPILHTNSKSGRTFVSQITTGTALLFAVSDDDGASWTPAGAGPPPGTEDHQTVGTGPYPAGSPFATIAQAAGVDYATYYCGQTTVTAFCARSDNGGLTFNNGVPIFSTQVDCGSATGALHGHVKVAPDGSVYVPPKDCGGSQAVIVSEDAGLTWATRKLPNTDADTEIDPAVAIDADNTVYDCYVAKNGHPHVQVSKDHGKTWSNDYDIGASQKIELATFPAAIGGSSGRAACAFIGSTTPGNHDALDYPGIWYGFVATTYDGGKSWHTVNVTPNDPVQGAGGVCNAGTLTCGQNRNLLDFNEITLDEFGRVMFGFADGCTGACVQDPVNANAFSAKASVARQTGGRSLLAQFDKTEPGRPAAACLSGLRTSQGVNLSWKAPDSGGAAISGYNIFRGATIDTIGTTPIAQTPAKTSYVDTTADPTAQFVYYKITALNAQGEGTASNIVKLPVVPLPKPESACTTPGITAATDSAGDAVPQSDAIDLLSLSVAEPKAMADKLVFTVKVASLSTVPPATYWFVLTQDKAKNNLYLAMDTSTVTPRYTYGTYTDLSAGVLNFTEVGTLDAASGYNADGTITLIAPKSIFGAIGPGYVIAPLEARTRVGSSAATSRDTTSSGSYTLRAANACDTLLAPLADLVVTPQSGTAPLSVLFDARGSTTSNPGATVVNYHFDFADGSSVTQSVPTVTHVYSTPGMYPATVSVVDSLNQSSTNEARKVITVNDAGGSTGGTSGGTSGGTTGGTTGGGSTGGTSGGSSGGLSGGLSGGSSGGSTGSGARSGGSLAPGLLIALAALAGLRRRRTARR